MKIKTCGLKRDSLFTRLGICAWVIIISSCCGYSQEKLTYPDLANWLIDLENLALLPSNGEKQSLWTGDDSSIGYYEPVDMNKSNFTGKEYLRKEGDNYVLAEMEGPGIITSLWAALPGEGRMKFFLDGSAIPAVNSTLYELYGLWSRKYPNLVYRTGRSLNFFIPIPYQKSCKIVAEEDWGEYLHIGYRTLNKGTSLPVFKSEFGIEEHAALQHVNNILNKKGSASVDHLKDKDIVTDTIILTINPGETITVFQVEGTRAITSLSASLDLGKLIPDAILGPRAQIRWPLGTRRELPDGPEDKNVLRELMLAIYWDGEEVPSVFSPLGDFFGTSPGWNEYRSYPTGMTGEKLYSHWFMPFKSEARIILRNDGVKERVLTFEISHIPVEKPIDKYGRFHAMWNKETSSHNNHGQNKPDWTLLKTTGNGRFCGLVIDIYNPVGKWWGDCAYTFTVDQEEYPSIKGYGLDPYFGTWGNSFFSEAFHAHTITDRSMIHWEHESLNRWHIIDNIPFAKSLEIQLKKWFPTSDSISYTSTLFWYMDAEHHDNVVDVPVQQRIDPEISSKHGITNCIEGEDMKITYCSGGVVTPLNIEGLHTGGWSGLRGKTHLWWKGIHPGDTLKLAIHVEEEGEYKIRSHFIRGEEYGQFKLYIDDQLLEDSLDLYHKGLAPLGPVDYGVHWLNKGPHSITCIALDSNASGTTQFGLDYLQLEPWDGTRDPQPKDLHVTAGDFINIYDRNNINDHCFIGGTDGLWHFYGIGGGRGFAHGTSDSLLSHDWAPQASPFPVEWNPWKEMHLWAPHVVKHKNIYYMFYCAGGKIGSVYRMHLATSPDLKNWTKHPDNPLFIDGFDARDPMVLKVGEKWVIYYCANTNPRGGNHIVAYRLSDDLVHWGERNIAFVDPRIHKAGGPTESPFVVRRGDTYYLFIGPREGYVGTDVFASKDPFRWYLEDKVGHIDSHAAEVVRNTDGKWYVSHSGVGEGGLYLAPIYWNDGLDEAESSIPVP